MFGNRLIYNQSPGGKRRGLIYQSSETGIYVNGNQIFFGTVGDGLGDPSLGTANCMNIKFKTNGNVVLNIPDEWFTRQNHFYYDPTIITLYDKWYPISMTPIYKFKIDNVVIDMNNFDTIVDMTNKFMFKKETCDVQGYDGSTTTMEFLFLYYDITGVPVTNNFYDFRGLETGHDFLITGVKYKYDITKTIKFEFEGNIRYYTYKGDKTFRYNFPDGTGYFDGVLGQLNALNHGTAKTYGCFAKYIDWSPTSPWMSLDHQNSGFYKIEAKGNAGIKVDGTAGSDGYECPLFFGGHIFFSMREYFWNKQTHQTEQNTSNRYNFYAFWNNANSFTPSGVLLYASDYTVRLKTFIFSMRTSLFDVPAFFIGHDYITRLEQLNVIAGGKITLYNPYGSTGQGIETQTLDEVWMSDYPFPI